MEHSPHLSHEAANDSVHTVDTLLEPEMKERFEKSCKATRGLGDLSVLCNVTALMAARGASNDGSYSVVVEKKQA